MQTAYSIDNRLLLESFQAVAVDGFTHAQITINDSSMTLFAGRESMLAKAVIPRDSFFEFSANLHDERGSACHVCTTLIIKFLRLCQRLERASLVELLFDNNGVLFRYNKEGSIFRFRDSMRLYAPFVEIQAFISLLHQIGTVPGPSGIPVRGLVFLG